MITTIATGVRASFSGFPIEGDVVHDSERHVLLLDEHDEESPASVISINLDMYGLEPQDDTVFIKDWSENSGLTDSLVDAGVVAVVNTHQVGPFASTAYEVRVLASEKAVAA